MVCAPLAPDRDRRQRVGGQQRGAGVGRLDAAPLEIEARRERRALDRRRERDQLLERAALVEAEPDGDVDAVPRREQSRVQVVEHVAALAQARDVLERVVGLRDGAQRPG
jgi:hypothetical protein